MELHIGSLITANYPEKIIVDCKDLQIADDGDTCYYGGSVKVGDKEVAARGNDRGGYSWHEDVYDELCGQFGILELEELRDILNGADFSLNADEYFTLSMPKDGTDQERLKELTVKKQGYEKVLK